MLSRIEHTESPTVFPRSWQEEIINLFYDAYKDECEKSNKEFKAFGQSFPKELVLIISLLDKEDQSQLPVTYCVSADLDEKSKPKVLIDNLIDSVGVFFDSYFSDENWDEYEATWSETEFRGTKLYYKITRENIELTLDANSLLENS